MSMLADYEVQMNVLMMVEAAQRKGRTEEELHTIVTEYFDDGVARSIGLGRERRLGRPFVAAVGAARARLQRLLVG
jgi:hypothetical protein